MRRRFLAVVLCAVLLVTQIAAAGVAAVPDGQAISAASVIRIVVNDTTTSGDTNVFSYSSGWSTTLNNARFYNGDEHWTSTTADQTQRYYTVKFYGHGIEIYGSKGPNLGVVTYSVDGGEAQTADLSAGSNQDQTLMFAAAGLEEGEHVLTVRGTNDKGQYSQYAAMQVDYAVVLQTPTDIMRETIVNDSVTGTGVNQFRYSAGWSTSTGYYSRFYLGDEHWTTMGEDQTQRYYTFRFYGNAIQIYGSKSTNLGVVSYYVDDGEPKTADLSAGSNQDQTLMFAVTGLEEGEHLLTVRGTGERGQFSANDRSTAIQVDYAVVIHLPYVISDLIVEEEISLYEGRSKQLAVGFEPAYADAPEDIAYASDNEDVAVVSEEGLITGVAAGVSNITVSAEGITKTAAVTVLPMGTGAHGIVGDTNTHYTQDRFDEVLYTSGRTEDVYAWKNDLVNSEIVIAALQDLTNVTVSAGDFVSDNGVLAKENIAIGRIQEVKGNMGYGMGAEPKPSFPDIIYGDEPFAVAGGKLQPVWIAIATPADAQAGIYSGQISVTADQLDEPLIFNYTLEILDIVMPDYEDYSIKTEMWQYPDSAAAYYQVEPWSEEHINILKKQAVMTKEFGANQITVPLIDEPWVSTGGIDQTHTPSKGMVKWIKNEDGSLSFDFSNMDTWIQLNIDAAKVDKIALFGMIPWAANYTFYQGSVNGPTSRETNVTVGGTRWTEIWGAFLDAFVPHMEEKGWFDKCYMAADERSRAQMLSMINLIAQKPNSKGELLKKSFALNSFGDDWAEVTSQADAVFVGYSIIVGNTAAFERFRDARNADTTKEYVTGMYTCTGMFPNSFTYSMPGEGYYVMMYAGSKDINGFLRWALDAYVADPLRDTSHRLFESGDCFLYYPDEVENKADPVTKFSVRLRKLIEGAADVSKLSYLAANDPSLQGEIDALYATVKSGYSQKGSAVASDATREVLPQDMKAIKAQIRAISKAYVDNQTAPAITSVTVTTPTIVETLAANLRINAEGKNLEGQTLTAYLSVNGVIDESTSTDITSGTALMKIAAAPAAGSDCQVVVTADGGAQGSVAITVAAYNPEELWSPVPGADGEGFLTVQFAEDIAPGTKGYGAKVNQTAYACEQIGARLLRINTAAAGVTSVVISGVKYPVLFPSYSFTFTIAIND